MQMNLELPEEFSEELKKTVTEVVKESLGSFSTDSKYPEFMDKTQCASYLSISIGTFNNWLKNEKIPFMLIGGSYRFKKSEINKFMLSKQK
ncbi:MAG: helix-turn-helix domain-containing protein [Liquorilactobacillus hordei]|uniref:helix-turn-helix domain-containing protein n=3 Tax=Liquorilactobacillus TaxID=2767888 RepID=UPI0039E78796